MCIRRTCRVYLVVLLEAERVQRSLRLHVELGNAVAVNVLSLKQRQEIETKPSKDLVAFILFMTCEAGQVFFA